MSNDLKALVEKLEEYEHYDKFENGRAYLRIVDHSHDKYVGLSNPDNKEIEQYQELYHVFPDSDCIFYKIDNNEDIILKANGEYCIPSRNKRGKYVINEYGYIECTDSDSNTTITYSHNGVMTVGQDDFEYNNTYTNQHISSVGGISTFTRINHIEYNREAYRDLMNSIDRIVEEGKEKLESYVSSIGNICSGMRPYCYPYGKESIDSTMNLFEDIENLNIKINYSLLAYDACDVELKDDVDKHLVDTLFDCFSADLVKRHEDILSGSVRYENGRAFLEYSASANFKQLEGSYQNLMEIDKDLTEKANNIKNLYENIDARISNMSNQDIKTDLYYILDHRGKADFDSIYYTIENMCPENYQYYHLEPVNKARDSANYDYNRYTIGDYQTNSDFITITSVSQFKETFHFTYEIAQVLPKDCTSIENLAYDIIKTNVINCLRSQPHNALEYIDKKNNNLIVLTCDPKSQNQDFKIGYYCENVSYPATSHPVVIDAHQVMNEVMRIGNQKKQENYYYYQNDFSLSPNDYILDLTTRYLAYNYVDDVFKCWELKKRPDEKDAYYAIYTDAIAKYNLYTYSDFTSYITSTDYTKLVESNNYPNLRLILMGYPNRSSLRDTELTGLRYKRIVSSDEVMESVANPYN